jgi:threonylcarbamoyladenosine tRNA methylthiotransferase MtaB
MEEILRRARALEEAGFAETGLCGVNISLYRDVKTGAALGGLLSYLQKNTKKIAFRLGSIEPEFFNAGGAGEEFLEAVKSSRVRPHFHLSVQSGSAVVLQKMGRNYTARDVLSVCQKLREARRGPFLACDIITGFPGETEEFLEETQELCRTAGFAWIHAFPFSPRPGTAAWAMKPKVPERLAVQRVSKLTALAEANHAAYRKRVSGLEVEAVMEASKPGAWLGADEKTKFTAVTENYLKVRLDSRDYPGIVPGGALKCAVP